jgi:hypothetical protein
MLLTSRRGGKIETFPGDGALCRARVDRVWRYFKGYDAGPLGLRREGVCRIHGDRFGAWLDPLLHTVIPPAVFPAFQDVSIRNRGSDPPHLQSGGS